MICFHFPNGLASDQGKGGFCHEEKDELHGFFNVEKHLILGYDYIRLMIASASMLSNNFRDSGFWFSDGGLISYDNR